LISIQRFITHYALTLATLSYITGILLHSNLIGHELPGRIVLLGVITAAISLRFIGLRFPTPLLIIPIFFFFGTLQGAENRTETVDPSHIVAAVKDQQRIVVVGTLSEMVSESIHTSRAVVEVKFIRTAEDRTFTRQNGKILLVLRGSWPAAIVPGQPLIVNTKMQVPARAAAPGAFDYRKYLAGRSIYLTGLVDSPILIQPVKDVHASWHKALFYKIERSRTSISRYIEKNLPPHSASLYQGLLVGDRSSIAPGVMETLKKAGILHLWAISGMHLGLLSVLTYTSIYWLLRRSETVILAVNVKKTALLLTLPSLFLYALLSGFQPPAARALIMTSCMVFALCSDRLHSTITTLSGAALIILLIDPLAVQSPSFQLSFAAVAAIVLTAPRLFSLVGCSAARNHSLLLKIPHLLAAMAVITVAATIGTLPLLLFHFNRVSLVTLPANLLIQPLICFFSLPLGMLSLPFIVANHPAAALLLKTGALGLSASQAIAASVSAPDWTQLWVPTPHPSIILLFYILLFSIATQPIISRPLLLKIVGLAAAVGMLLHPFRLSILLGQPPTTVTILNVGHGSANLVEFTNGRVVLIDGGARSAPGYDCGARIIAPYLWHRGIGKIDDIIITHDDTDHYNGIFTLLSRFKPERLWLPHLDENKPAFTRLVDRARLQGITIITPAAGVIIAGDDEQISVLGDHRAAGLTSEDDRGLVVRLTSGGKSVLFPGDITTRRELELVAAQTQVRSTILLSPHHGSATSNSPALLSGVSPEWLIISSGTSGYSQFPAKKTLETARELEIPILNTALDGTIVFEIRANGHGSQLVYEKIQERYWRAG
jgi:competence protein ComEC